MAVMRMGYMHVKVTDLAEAKDHYANTLGLYQTLEQDGKVYYKGWDEWDHHSVVIEEGGVGYVRCGFKCFRADVAEQVFPLVGITGWTFDVEALFIARRLGYTITEIAIPWYYNAHSNIRVLRDSLHMGTDLLKIRWNALTGKYHAPR